MAHRRRIVQVLNNLFSNAARHSSESSPIRVEATLGGVLVEVWVSDEGVGVPPGQLPHLFHKYTGPGTDDREGAASGHAVGLAICKGLVEAHGERIRGESAGLRQGHGSASRFPWRRMRRRAPPGRPGSRSAYLQEGVAERRFWWSTTIPRPSGTFGTP